MANAQASSANTRRSGIAVMLPSVPSGRAAAIVARATAVVLLALIGLFHLIEAPGHFVEQPYLGVLFWLTVAGSWLAAIGIASGVRGSWILGALVSAATFFGLILAVTVGLPNFSENLSENLAVPSLFVEAGYLVVYVAASTGRSSPLGT